MPTATQSLPESAVAFYELGQRYSAAGVLSMRSLWRRMSVDNIDGTWTAVAPDALRTLATLQAASARDAATYVGDVLGEQGMNAPAVATVQPLAFVRGSSGLPLSDVLATVPAAVKAAIGTGARDAALSRGLTLLEGIAETQIADAARLATQAASVARPAVRTWVRVLNPPSCGRCAVMAGSVYRWNATFQRHPRCDCRTMPSADASPEHLTFDPHAYFNGLSAAEQDLRFGKSVAAEVRNGGDLVKAVNAPRDAWRVRLANEREAIAPRWGSASGATTAQTPQTFMESLIHQVNDRNTAIRNLADAGFLAA